MNILIFFALALATIVVAIFLNRLVRCPILVGFLFFSITLLIAVIFSNTTLIVVAIILGILAFLASLLDCILKNSCFFRNNGCLNCYNPYIRNTNNNNENCDNTLMIVNSNGEVVAKISGDSINCINNNENNVLSPNSNDNCCCNNRFYRGKR